MTSPADSTCPSSEDKILKAPDDIPRSESSKLCSLKEDLQAPATMGDIQALMNNIRAFFNAGVDITREDISMVTAKVRGAEESVTSVAQRQVR
ncbi:Hypothetical predicted protein [Pelobates cultripes]|uniref:Uncharacterized protein n=1 Tax=Pelobates cultripes TaxID=61616 RepID=A0AAD1SAL2_PELCU|nr:Hypothetical predicted protein [Pelobates cultripes]